MAARCATPRLLTYEYPPVVHQHQSLLQAFPFHPIQATTYVMTTADVISGLLRAYRETHRVFEPSPSYYAVTEEFSVDELAPGDRSAADTLEYDTIMRAVSWAAVFDRLPFQHDPTRPAPSTLLPHQVGTVADRRCHSVRVVSVPRSPQAPLGVILAEPRLADVVPRTLLVTWEACAVPAGFISPDPGDVPPSVEEAAVSASCHARKRRHADIVRGAPAQPGPHAPRSQAVASPGDAAWPAGILASGVPACEPGPRDFGVDEEEASIGGCWGPAVGHRGSAATAPAGSAEWGQRTAAGEDGSGPAHDRSWAKARRDDHPGAEGHDFGGGWVSESGGDAAGARNDDESRWEGGHGRDADARGEHAWHAASPDDGRGHAAAGRDGPVWRSDSGQARGGDARDDRYWGPEHRCGNGEYPTAGAGAAAGSRPAGWDAGPDRDCPAMAPLDLRVAGPEMTPVPRQLDVAYDWWL